MDNLYSIEIDAGFQKKDANAGLSRAGPSDNRVVFMQDESRPDIDASQIQFGGKGGNLTDMRFIRMKVKSLVVEDGGVLRELHGQTEALSDSKFSLTLALPLPDVYKRSISN